MEHADHVALIRDGVTGAGPRWLELGCGEGAFTLALAELLGEAGRILATDIDRRALSRLSEAARSRRSAGLRDARIDRAIVSLSDTLPRGPFDGVLAANVLHFVRERSAVLAAIHRVLVPGGRLIVVEYDADRGNPWVPHPFSFERWTDMARDAGFEDVRLIGLVPSRFLGGMYAAVCRRP
jgi:ubiquinone/menaquinone biosynthesis C-methylase UbiE